MLTKIANAVPPQFKLLAKLYAIHLLIFLFYRFLHYFINQTLDVNEVSSSDILSGFLIGLRFDTSLIAYSFFIPLLLFSINSFTNSKINLLDTIAIALSVGVLVVYQFVCAADIPYYKQFGNHVNHQIFLWNDAPDFAVGLIFGDIGYWGYILVFLLTAMPSIYFSRKLFKNYKKEISGQKTFSLKTTTLFFLLFASITFLAARGRISGKSTLHEGVGIISTNAFANSIAVNPNFTFWKSMLEDRDESYAVPANIKEQIAFTRNYLGITSPFAENLTRHISDTSEPKKLNVVIVIMESMSVFKMGYYNGKNLTPNLYNIIKESAYFDHFFSSGIHTFNGLFSTTSGFPSILEEQPLRKYLKAPFPSLGKLLKSKGYDTYFFTSHDPHFDNMAGFFKNNYFDNIISESDMPIGSSVSELGAPDHVLFEQVITSINNRKSDKPFLSVVLTSSDHGPWVIPKNIPFKPDGETLQDNCTLYADWSIGKFFNEVKNQDWYKNTIFMFLGDHGLSLGHTYEMPLSFNHIPFIVHCKEQVKPEVKTNLGYQPDVTATVMGLLNESYTNETFGVDLFKQEHPFVFFSADNRIGCVNNRGYYYYKLLSQNKERLWKYENLEKTDYINIYKPMADSMRNATNAILQTAHYLIRKNYYQN